MTAGDTARAEAASWSEIHDLARHLAEAVTDPLPDERAVTGVDVADDLARRADRWGHRMPDTGLAELARFAAALAVTEAEAWERDDAIVATRAFEDRRFLFSDRIVHWAVPWADVAGRCHPDARSHGDRLRDLLLDLGERLRPAPLLTGPEGLHPPGEDAYGPLEGSADLAGSLRSLHCGTVIFDATVWSMTDSTQGRKFHEVQLTEPELRSNLVALFENAAARWNRMANEQPGTERLWRDLSRRAQVSARLLAT